MFETKSEYKEFFPLAKRLLEREDRMNLVNLLEQPKIKNLFLHNVDHPMGYEDGPSGVSYLRLKRRNANLTDQDRRKLYEISERVMREVEDNFSQLSQTEKATALLGINQLVQNASWQNYRPNSRDKIRENLIERISKTYTENPQNIKKIDKWDAQILENKGFYHLKPNEMAAMGSLMSIVPTMIVAMIFKENPVANFYINNIMPIAMGSMTGIIGHQLALVAQDLPGDKKSPNTTNKLQTKRQYSLQRHPLYFWKGVLGVVPGITSLNPIGLYFASKSAYQLSKACEFQDERMKILYGKEAEDYQNNVPAFIPGSKILSKGLRKVLPEKVADVLDTPVSHYLEKIPGIKNEKYYTDNWVTRPSYNKGSPTCYVGTDLEKRTHVNPLKDMGEVFLGAGKLMTYDLGKWTYKKVSKKLNQRKRRIAWEKSQSQIDLEKIIT